MLKKTYSNDKKKCKVTFELPGSVGADSAYLCGEFNNWDEHTHPMKKKKNGDFTISLMLDTGRAYRFRYRITEDRWENDWSADNYVPNVFGGEDSVLDLSDAAEIA